MTHTYFGYDAWAAHAPGLKTIGEALDVRRRILRAFEAAELEPSAEQRRAWTTFVVIGGGPTGVELAGALAEIAGRTLARDFRSFDPRATRVILIEAGPRILSTFSERLSQRAREDLEGLGIEVRTGTPVSDLGADFVEIGAEHIAARTILWAAGVRASPLTSHLGVPIDRAGRVWVEEDLSVPDRPEVFVCGDLIAKTQDGKPLPGVAQLAMQSGRHAALNIVRSVSGRAARAVPLRRQGLDGDDRPQQGGRAGRALRVHRHRRVVAVADRAHPVLGRLSQPDRRGVRVGVGVFHLAAPLARDPGGAARARSGTRDTLAQQRARRVPRRSATLRAC